MWWGKIIGGMLGLMLGNAFTLFLGVLIGHFFDKGFSQLKTLGGNPFFQLGEAQRVFFDTTFSVMGHLAKADGRVSESEIQNAREIMARLRLNEEQRRRAMECFNAGKVADFDLEAAVGQLRQAIRGQVLLMGLFVRLQYQAAMADGGISAAEQQVLDKICSSLGVRPDGGLGGGGFGGFGAGADYGRGGQYGGGAAYQPDLLGQAYETLGVDAEASDADVKKAYRRRMSENHPDKLVAKGLPEAMIKLATEKTQEIQKAYETIMKTRA